jgi:hypothetical protein
MVSGRMRMRSALVAGCVMAAAACFAVASRAGAQVQMTGQDVVPVYEGWEQNEDGSFNLVFGYFNRNWEEDLDVPIGPDNTIQPGEPDQGQPTHFLPRRNRFLVRIRVPKDFGNKEVVWTLTSRGKTTRAYATLKPDYFIDDLVIMNNNGAGGPGGGSPDTHGNKPPKLEVVDGQKSRRVKVGEPVMLAAVATDDGKPRTRPMPAAQSEAARAARGTPNSATGLRLSWFVYRGAGKVIFESPQIETWEDYRDGTNSPWSAGWRTPPTPPENKWETRVTFAEPGTYVLRCQAHDGGLSATEDVTFVVTR